MTTGMPAGPDRDKRVLQLFSAAMPLHEIKAQVGLRDVRQVEAALRRALDAVARGRDADTERRVEVERLDALYRALYPKALRGDATAADRCMRIGEQRLRLLALPGTQDDGLVAAFDRTVAALELDGERDATVVAAGRTVAAQIDWATTHGAGQDVTKALYLLPHLMNVLRELGATPAARAEVAGAMPAADGGGRSGLDEFVGEHLRAV